MNLLNRSIKYLMVSIFIIVSIWSVIFYFSMLDEIYDSIDDGLDNYKLLILQKAEADTVTLSKSTFDESNYSINLIDRKYASTITDTYLRMIWSR
jgi:two-component system, OmpR family, sensor histidine kinase QseC